MVGGFPPAESRSWAEQWRVSERKRVDSERRSQGNAMGVHNTVTPRGQRTTTTTEHTLHLTRLINNTVQPLQQRRQAPHEPTLHIDRWTTHPTVPNHSTTPNTPPVRRKLDELMSLLESKQGHIAERHAWGIVGENTRAERGTPERRGGGSAGGVVTPGRSVSRGRVGQASPENPLPFAVRAVHVAHPPALPVQYVRQETIVYGEDSDSDSTSSGFATTGDAPDALEELLPESPLAATLPPQRETSPSLHLAIREALERVNRVHITPKTELPPTTYRPLGTNTTFAIPSQGLLQEREERVPPYEGREGVRDVPKVFKEEEVAGEKVVTPAVTPVVTPKVVPKETPKTTTPPTKPRSEASVSPLPIPLPSVSPEAVETLQLQGPTPPKSPPPPSPSPPPSRSPGRSPGRSPSKGANVLPLPTPPPASLLTPSGMEDEKSPIVISPVTDLSYSMDQSRTEASLLGSARRQVRSAPRSPEVNAPQGTIVIRGQSGVEGSESDSESSDAPARQTCGNCHTKQRDTSMVWCLNCSAALPASPTLGPSPPHHRILVCLKCFDAIHQHPVLASHRKVPFTDSAAAALILASPNVYPTGKPPRQPSVHFDGSAKGSPLSKRASGNAARSTSPMSQRSQSAGDASFAMIDTGFGVANVGSSSNDQLWFDLRRDAVLNSSSVPLPSSQGSPQERRKTPASFGPDSPPTSEDSSTASPHKYYEERFSSVVRTASVEYVGSAVQNTIEVHSDSTTERSQQREMREVSRGRSESRGAEADNDEDMEKTPVSFDDAEQYVKQRRRLITARTKRGTTPQKKRNPDPTPQPPLRHTKGDLHVSIDQMMNAVSRFAMERCPAPEKHDDYFSPRLNFKGNLLPYEDPPKGGPNEVHIQRQPSSSGSGLRGTPRSNFGGSLFAPPIPASLEKEVLPSAAVPVGEDGSPVEILHKGFQSDVQEALRILLQSGGGGGGGGEGGGKAVQSPLRRGSADKPPVAPKSPPVEVGAIAITSPASPEYGGADSYNPGGSGGSGGGGAVGVLAGGGGGGGTRRFAPQGARLDGFFGQGVLPHVSYGGRGGSGVQVDVFGDTPPASPAIESYVVFILLKNGLRGRIGFSTKRSY